MTKFEEELNKIVVEVQTPLDKYIVEKATSDESLYAQHYEAVLEKFKDWHSDEDYQRAKRMVEHVQVENEMLKAKLKSQLQQQSLPVVPECVGEWIEHCKGMGYGLIAALTFKLSSTMHEELSAKILKWLGNEGNDETFALAFITGKYEVEKPQLFYLKHIDMSETDKHYDWFTIKHWDGPLSHLRVEKGQKPSTIDCKFTQSEIESMQTGSYELVPVEDGE
ncbi:DUF1642 domain-containing protein [Lactococcus lactis]|uniref:DUF1642 domain-containing protein n=1 Tax=Lactococcus lactis TaxID=1358 RepID=UPI002074517F|nr:DUF1642 domain-containing protein [Lactococcus lactis]